MQFSDMYNIGPNSKTINKMPEAKAKAYIQLSAINSSNNNIDNESSTAEKKWISERGNDEHIQ